MRRTWREGLREGLMVLVSASIAVAPGLSLGQSQSGPDQVVDGAKKVGEGAAETAKETGKKVADAGKRAGEKAGDVGDRLHDSAKGFGEALYDGMKQVGRTLKNFFTGD